MANITVYDLKGTILQQLKKLDIFNDPFSNIVFYAPDETGMTDTFLEKHHIHIILVTDYFSHTLCYEMIQHIHEYFPDIAIIMLSYNNDYENIRKAFLSNVKDYILLPLDSSTLKNSIQNIETVHTMPYIHDILKTKLHAMIEYIFNGGDDVYPFIHNITQQIYSEQNNNVLEFQLAIEQLKHETYRLMISKKPWIEKFLYKGNYIRNTGFETKSQNEIEHELYLYFSELCWIFKKYNLIDDDPITYTAGKYIILHVDEKLSLEIVAKQIGLNPTYLSHIFKETLGIGFQDFVTDVKLERAKILLHSPKMQISEVALLLGYSSTGYFSRVFRMYVGISPSEYQTRISYLENIENDTSINLYLHRWKPIQS
ncbi:response regulator transcription factor [Roseburia sp. MSJ-14]|uniref:response regulator transcription factor n=1 Tax=Roseburia sp. MSJ-14 TaxID=2841514 RepID=UPI001C103EA6|nr:helix-turn-helix domain-containing protein [Roseburia sp. MSJ-14]MBU5472333.1 DNA-binding response regulator [Roseburia sp. MSJ-14]